MRGPRSAASSLRGRIACALPLLCGSLSACAFAVSVDGLAGGDVSGIANPDSTDASVTDARALDDVGNTADAGGDANADDASFRDAGVVDSSDGAAGRQCTFLLTMVGSHTWTVPGDWNSSSNVVEVIGGGGGGSNGMRGNGGGGGAYAKVQNLVLSPGSSVSYSVGAPGTGGPTSPTPSAGNDGGDTWFNGATFAGSSVAAKGGIGATTASYASSPGGSASSSMGSTTFSGGVGSGSVGSSIGGSGGGGAAGPHGVGMNGTPAPGDPGGGGGAGDFGMGGGGGAGGTVQQPAAGPGGSGAEWMSSPGGLPAGSGGGGGGGLGSSGTSGTVGAPGGAYGGGGGGGGYDSAPNYHAGGNGGQGLVVVTYQGTTCS